MKERKQGKQETGSGGGADWTRGRKKEPETAALDRLLAGLEFPTTKEEVARQLAVEAFSHEETRAVELHDLIIQLDDHAFRNLDVLHRAIRERHSWEKTHDILV
jgi:hypothetical protein